jgi:hypothetical protein
VFVLEVLNLEINPQTMNYLKRLVEYRDVVEPLLPPVPASLGSKIANVSAIGEYIGAQ